MVEPYIGIDPSPLFSELSGGQYKSLLLVSRKPSCPSACCFFSRIRAKILFLLQLLTDHIPGVGLVASKCG